MRLGRRPGPMRFLASAALVLLLATRAGAERRPAPRRRPPPPAIYRPQLDHPVTDAMLVGNVASFAAFHSRKRVMTALAKWNFALSQGQYYRLVTACFLHASPAHLLVNCVSLNSIGPTVELFFGSRRFALLYFVSGVSGNLLSWGLGRAPLSVGASGAIFGLMGGWGVFLATNKPVLEVHGFHRVEDTLGALVRTCALNIAIGLSPGSHLDNFGHLGGLMGGAICASLIGPRLRDARVGFGGTMAIVDEPVIALPNPAPPRPQRNRNRTTQRRLL